MKHNLATLSFAKTGAAGQIVSLWPDAPRGSYTEDCTEGRRRADEVVRAMEQFENPTLLTHIVTAIVGNQGVLGGLEIGFFTRIGHLAIEGALHGSEVQPAEADNQLTLHLVVDNQPA